MNLKYRRAWQTASWVLLGIVTYLSLMPAPPAPFTFNSADKLEHSIAYLALALCFCQSHTHPLRWMGLLIAWGIGIEYAQGWTGYRYFDIWDMVANGTGVLLGGFLTRKTVLGNLFVGIENWRK
jgi:VanZ family protein